MHASRKLENGSTDSIYIMLHNVKNCLEKEWVVYESCTLQENCFVKCNVNMLCFRLYKKKVVLLV
jgi:hypothetical protein